MGGVLFSGDVFSDVPAEDMRGMLQDAARALLAPEG
jgi:hypothetical protein